MKTMRRTVETAPLARSVAAACLAAFAALPAFAQSTAMPGMEGMPAAEEKASTVPPRADAPPKKQRTEKRKVPATSKEGAASASEPSMKGMDHSRMQGMDMGGKTTPDDGASQGMDHGSMDHGQMPGAEHGPTKEMDHQTEHGTDHGPKEGMKETSTEPMPEGDMGDMVKSMQGGKAPPDARDPDAYADGLSMGSMSGMDMSDRERRTYVLLDRLEQFHGHRTRGQALDAQAWFGSDLDKLWLKVDGERSNGRLGATRTEALWDHAIATYWSLQTGVRHDFGEGPGRTWGAIGIQGLAPYWFDVQATAYVGEGGRTALRLEAEYDLLITQRLILQPDVKVDVFGKSDPRREVGSGLSQIEAGLRLRYELSRKFAPYVGVVAVRQIGNTGRLVRDEGRSATQVRAVVGIRAWY